VRNICRHHRETIDNVAKKLRAADGVLALIVAGSIAHGFAQEDADVDIMIVVSPEEYERRHREQRELYWERESATYPGGYVDGKYVSADFIREIGRRGGEPARFAFKDAYLAFSDVPGLDELMRDAARYPRHYKEARMRRLYSRFLEWNWFYAEGTNKRDPYLVGAAICNIVLFGGRVLLAWNELLYPFHKWFLKVLDGAPDKPAGIMETIREALDTRAPESVARFIAAIKGFRDWGIADNEWAKVLMAGEDIGCWESEL
jgi:predicted nucleotidyltransferase